MLEVLDIGLKVVDYFRLGKAILQSNTLEEWDLKAREVQVNLTPQIFSIARNDTQRLTARIKTSLGDNAPAIEYDWKLPANMDPYQTQEDTPELIFPVHCQMLYIRQKMRILGKRRAPGYHQSIYLYQKGAREK